MVKEQGFQNQTEPGSNSNHILCDRTQASFPLRASTSSSEKWAPSSPGPSVTVRMQHIEVLGISPETAAVTTK